MILKNEGNVILSEGLVLQDADVWGKTLNETSTPFNNMMELYFEDFDIDGLLAKYESGKYSVRYATELTELAVQISPYKTLWIFLYHPPRSVRFSAYPSPRNPL